MPALQITTPELPGAVFAGRHALLEYFRDALAYERAVADFAANRDSEALTVALSDLGYDRAEIARHTSRPGERQAQLYVSARDL